MHVGDLIDQGLAFSVGEFVGMGDGLRGRTAVLAGQITGLCDFPDGQKRRFVEVQPAAGGNCVHRFHGEPPLEPGLTWTAPGSNRALERGVTSDSYPEDQHLRVVGCDWDHFIWGQFSVLEL